MTQFFQAVPVAHLIQGPSEGSNSPSIRWNWVTLAGPDAQDFLHRVTTVNTKSLPLGQGASGCFLNAQGKIRVYFTLWHFDAGSYAFEFDAGSSDHWKTGLLAAIDQYTFSEKMTVTDLSEQLHCTWIFGEPEPTENHQKLETLLEKLGVPGLKAKETRATEEEIRICYHGTGDYGRPWFTAWGRPGRVSQWVDRVLKDQASPLSSNELESWRIAELRPRADFEITDTSIPLEIGLRDAISENKGCYPGQEVIERIVSLGAPARRLALLEGQGALPKTGDPIFNLATPPAEVGQITSVVEALQDNSQRSFQALGFIRKIHAKEGLQVRFADPSSQGAILRIAPYD